MSSSAVTTACAILGGGFSTAMSFPQLRVIRRNDEESTRAISLQTWELVVLGGVLWVAYGFLTDAISMVIANGMTLVPALIIVLILARMRGSSIWLLAAASAVVTALAVVTRDHSAITGTIASLVTVWQRQPQLNGLLRRRAAGSLGDGGVSPLTWALSAVCTIAWTVYGILKPDAIVTITSVLLTMQAVAIYVLTRQAERAAIAAGHPELVVAD